MQGKISEKVKVPSQRDIKISDMAQKCGDRIHKIDRTRYCEGKIILSGEDPGALHEAVAVTENFLSYNGSWDFERNRYEEAGSCICELRFKWNGYLSMMDIIRNKLRLPAGVNIKFELFA